MGWREEYQLGMTQAHQASDFIILKCHLSLLVGILFCFFSQNSKKFA